MGRKLCYVVITLALLGLVSPAIAQVGKGNILIEEWYTNSTGQQVNADVTTLHNYINAGNPPDRSYWAQEMDRPDGGEDYWGDRMRGYIHPPQTGDYTFWTVSDDDSEVWLSTDDNPANVTMICNVEGWENYQNWTYSTGAAGTTYKSAPVHLEAGKKYYVEVYHSDGTGGGCVTVGWGGPGIGAGPVIVDGEYLSPVIRDPEPAFLAKNPSPADGATAVTMLLMQWEPGATALFHDVYFGTDPNPPKVAPMLTYTVYFHPMPLEPGMTYHWKIDEIEADGVTKHEGPVWSFETVPLTASSPRPRDGDKWIAATTTLEWNAGHGATAHDLYLGTDQAAVAARDAGVSKGTLPVPSYDPGPLADGTTYFWVVDEQVGATKHEGQVWSFTTVVPGTGGVKGEYFNGMTPTGVPALVRTDPEINFNWGDPGGPGEPIGVDSFSARWTADLEIAIADTYTIIGTSDDGIRIWLNDELIIDDWVDRSAADSFSAPIALEPGVYSLRVEYYENGGGASAQVSWQTPNMARAIIPGGPLTPPVRARATYPQDNDVNIPQDVTLMWGAGEMAAEHQVYFGDDEAAVAAADTSSPLFQGTQTETTFEPGTLEWNKAYFWRIDEVNDTEADSPWIGAVWSFTTADFLVVDNFESYNDEEGQGTRIYETWIDGWVDTAYGTSTVGNWDPPFCEQTIVHGGRQSMPLDYNNVNSPYYAEAALPLSSVQDWTVNGVVDLTLYVHGRPARFAESPDGTISMSGAGTDIWDTADEFRYAYKTLNGDGSMIARVVACGPGSNNWAKGGVMIRDTVNPVSVHAFMPLTAGDGGGASFQRRLLAADVSANDDATGVIAGGVAPPYWVKIERQGNDFSGYVSPDGVTWTQLGTAQTITMTAPVLIGLAVSSHTPGELRTFTFDNVSTTGNVTGGWTVVDIGVAQPANDPGALYVTLTDSTNKTATVTSPDASMALSENWIEWKIPLTDFTDVNASKVKELTIGIGDGTPDGGGRIYIDDIRVTKPAPPAPEPAE